MQTRLTKDVLLLVFHQASTGDPRTRQALNCVSKTVNRLLLSEQMLDCRLKSRLCQVIRLQINAYSTEKSKSLVRSLSLHLGQNPTINSLRKILKFTAMHANTLTIQQLPADSDILKFLNEKKRFRLSQLEPIEVFMLYLVEQHRMSRDPVVQHCLGNLQQLLCQNYPNQEDHMYDAFAYLQTLCPYDLHTSKGESDKFIYIQACEEMRMANCTPSSDPRFAIK